MGPFSNGDVNSSKSVFDAIHNADVFSSISLGVTDFMDVSLPIPFRFVWSGSNAPNTNLYDTTIWNWTHGMLEQKSYSILKVAFCPLHCLCTRGFEMEHFILNIVTESPIWERQLMLEPGLLAGKVGFLGGGFFWIEGSGAYWFRQPITKSTIYPSNELSYSLEMGYSFHPKIGIASCTYGYDRLGGLDYPTLDKEPSLEKVDQWAALDASQIKTGIKMNYYISDTMTSNVQFLLFPYILKTTQAMNIM